MTERCHATVTLPAPRETRATQWGDSVPAGSTSSAVSAPSAPQGTTVSPTAGVSEPCSTSHSSLKNCFALLLTLLLHFAACECGRRLCDEVTGSCICPPQTVRPACDVCEAQTFSYHPLLGCEGCNCSPSGIKDSTRPQCDRITGQCRCVEPAGTPAANKGCACSVIVTVDIFYVFEEANQTMYLLLIRQ